MHTVNRFFSFYLFVSLIATTTTSVYAGSVELTGDEENESGQIQEPASSPNTRRNLLAKAFDRLCDAIEANDIPTARELFTTYPGLVEFSYQPLGTPLHFVKSKAMTEFLVEQIGFSVNVCDQWGELPAKSIFLSQKNRFASRKEQLAIVRYLKARESVTRKVYNQLAYNRIFHMKMSICGMGVILAANLISIYLSLSHKTHPKLIP